MALQVEEGTPFARRYSAGQAPLPSDDAAASMYCTASTVLGAAGGARCQRNPAAQRGWQTHCDRSALLAYLDDSTYPSVSLTHHYCLRACSGRL